MGMMVGDEWLADDERCRRSKGDQFIQPLQATFIYAFVAPLRRDAQLERVLRLAT